MFAKFLKLSINYFVIVIESYSNEQYNFKCNLYILRKCNQNGKFREKNLEQISTIEPFLYPSIFFYLDLIFVPGRYFPLKLTYIKTIRFISISIRYENVFEVNQAGFENTLAQIQSIKNNNRGKEQNNKEKKRYLAINIQIGTLFINEMIKIAH